MAPDSEASRTGDILRLFAQPCELIRGYRRRYVLPDLLAGLTVATIVIPQSIAYASIADLPPHYGLFTAAVGAAVGAIWGSSRHLDTGPTNATSLLVLSILLAVAVPGTPSFLLAASTLAVLAGLLRIGFALLRFGALVTIASRGVILGFITGAAFLIGLGQVRHLLGLDLPPRPQLVAAMVDIGSSLEQTSWPPVALGAGTVVAIIALRRTHRRIPASLVAVILATVVVWLGDLEAAGVDVVGEIPRSLPPLTWTGSDTLPDWSTVRSLVTGAVAVAALGLIEGMAIAKTLARKINQRLDYNQEFFGQGMANVATGLFTGYACSGSLTRSSLRHAAGGRTQMAGVFTGLTVVASLLLFAPYARLIPKAAVAGVLLVLAWRMVDRRGIARVWQSSRSETLVMLATLVATLVLPLEFAVLFGVVLSLGFFVVKSAMPSVLPVAPDPTYRHFIETGGADDCPQLGVINIRGPIFFGAVHHVEQKLMANLEEHPGQNHLLLRMHGVELIDVDGIEMLENTTKVYRDLGGDVFLVRPRQSVVAMLRSTGALETIGEDHILPQEGAVEYLFDEVLDPSICIYECEQRMFAECQALEKHPDAAKLPPAARSRPRPEQAVDLKRFMDLKTSRACDVIDVREMSEFEKGHVAGAQLMPLRTIIDEAPRLPRDRTLLLVCRSGRRSARALCMLTGLGFADVFHLQGGMLAWRARGLPVEMSS